MKLAMARLATSLIVLLVLADALLTTIPDEITNPEMDEDSSSSEKPAKKQKRKKDQSTSSSSRDRQTLSENGDSLSITDGSTSSSTESDKDKSYIPKSTAERWGWRKWHRKCNKCPEDAKKKWKDPTIQWICGAYQRARRSFKSTCMMHYRNCQDGTMFVKIKSHRCPNETGQEDDFHGDHWFYEYKTKLSDESSDSKRKSYTSSTSIESDSESIYND